MSTAEIGQAVPGQAPPRAGLARPTAQPRPAVSWWGDVWRRFRRQRLSLAAAVVLIALALLALLAPVIAPYDPTEQFRREGLSALGEPLPPNARFWLGTDGLGRDLLSRLLWGGRISLAIGVSATAIVMATALRRRRRGRVRRRQDRLSPDAAGRPDDQRARSSSSCCCWSWCCNRAPGWSSSSSPSSAGPIRPASSVPRSSRSRRRISCWPRAALGVPERRIFLRHVLPHLLPLVTVYFALSMPGVIFAEASLSFLGLGVPPPTPVLGLDDPGRAASTTAPLPGWCSVRGSPSP